MLELVPGVGGGQGRVGEVGHGHAVHPLLDGVHVRVPAGVVVEDAVLVLLDEEAGVPGQGRGGGQRLPHRARHLGTRGHVRRHGARLPGPWPRSQPRAQRGLLL